MSRVVCVNGNFNTIVDFVLMQSLFSLLKFVRIGPEAAILNLRCLFIQSNIWRHHLLDEQCHDTFVFHFLVSWWRLLMTRYYTNYNFNTENESLVEW